MRLEYTGNEATERSLFKASPGLIERLLWEAFNNFYHHVATGRPGTFSVRWKRHVSAWPTVGFRLGRRMLSLRNRLVVGSLDGPQSQVLRAGTVVPSGADSSTLPLLLATSKLAWKESCAVSVLVELYGKRLLSCRLVLFGSAVEKTLRYVCQSCFLARLSWTLVVGGHLPGRCGRGPGAVFGRSQAICSRDCVVARLSLIHI